MADERSPELGRAVLESPLAESGAGVLESCMFFWIGMADVVDRRYPLAHPFKNYPRPDTPTHCHTFSAVEVNTVGKLLCTLEGAPSGQQTEKLKMSCNVSGGSFL